MEPHFQSIGKVAKVDVILDIDRISSDVTSDPE